MSSEWDFNMLMQLKRKVSIKKRLIVKMIIVEKSKCEGFHETVLQ